MATPLVNLNALADLRRTGIYRPGVSYGQSPFAGSSTGAALADAQVENVFKPALQKIRDDQRRRDLNILQVPTVPSPVAVAQPQSTRARGSLAPAAGAIPATAGVTPEGTLEAITLTRDPEIEGDLLNVLNLARTTDPGAVRSQPRSQRVDDVLGNELARFRGDASNAQESLRDFTANFLEDRPEYQALVDLELAKIRQTLAPSTDPNSLAGQLDANRQQFEMDESQTLRRVMNELARAGKLAEMRAPGGSNSYLARAQADAVANALLEDAARRTARGRQDILDVEAAQQGVLGRGDQLLDAYMRQGLVPIDAQSRLDASQIAALSQLLNLDQANTLVDRPIEDVNRLLQILAEASGIRRGIRHEGVGGSFGYDTPTAIPFQFSGGGGGGGDLDVATLLRLLESDGSSVPALNTTSGDPVQFAPVADGGALRSDLLSLLAQIQAGQNFDMGPGSAASNLGLPGVTTTNSRGEQFIMDPTTGQWELIGPDGLTDRQRAFA